MTVDKTIKLTRRDDQSITVSSGTDTFTTAFCEVPRVSDNAERRFQRVRKPLADVNETREDSPGPYFPFTIYGSPSEDNAKNKKKEKGSGGHFLAIKDDKAFAIRMIGDCKESAFKVKVWVGGVNVLQHTTHGKKSQDYFVVSEQKWVWGKQVGKDTARQFRVFRRGKERLSLRYQLRNNNIKKEVEIEITSRRLAQPTGNGPEPPQAAPPPHLYYPHYTASPAYYSGVTTASQATFQGPASNDTGPSTHHRHTMQPPPPPPLTASHELASENLVPPTIFEQAIPVIQSSRISYRRRQASQPALTELVHPLSSDDRSSSSPPPQHISQAPSLVDPDLITTISYDYEEPFLFNILSRPGPPESNYPFSAISQPSLPSLPYPPAEPASPKPPSDQESIHSDPEEDMLPQQMVVGTGGLIDQIVHPDKHPGPEWIDDCTVTLKFKIVDPEYLKKEAGVKKLGVLGGNYREVPSPPDGTFRGHAPVVTNPDRLRRDIRSPMEMETELNRNAGGKDRDREPPESPKRESPVDSGVGLVGEEGDEEDVTEFQRLEKEAKNQPRGLMNDIRMKKKRREQRNRGGVRIMVVKREDHEPKGERKSRWRTFVDVMRRVLTLGR